MEWIANNWATIVEVAGGVIVLASVIVKLTPNETDNKILAAVIRFFEILGLNTPPVRPKK